jgi:hypothetical protein
MGAARAPADTSSDAQQRNQEKRGAPAAPPAPDRTRRARRATPTSGRSRRSWPNPPQTHHGAIRRTTTRPPKQGLRIRPQSGYSSVRHLCGLLTEPVAGRPPTKDRAVTRSFSFRGGCSGGPRARNAGERLSGYARPDGVVRRQPRRRADSTSSRSPASAELRWGLLPHSSGSAETERPRSVATWYLAWYLAQPAHGTFVVPIGHPSKGSPCKRLPLASTCVARGFPPPAGACRVLPPLVRRWAGEDSNLRLSGYEPAALTAELPARQGRG